VIVHLGVGAFARAFVGVYTEGIRGVSLRSTPTPGPYTLVVREPDGDEIRELDPFVSMATGAEAAVEAVADPGTTMVTLTITEKGYDGEAPAVIAEGLARRDGRPVVVASLDNVAGNGALLRSKVGDVAGAEFPSSVVDRMVPAMPDERTVVAERHCSWIIQRVDGLPPLAYDVVDDVAPYQRRKLWLLNGPHSALANLGLQAGCATIAEAVADDGVSAFVRDMIEDVLEVADVPDGRAFAEEALRRFANPALGHTCAQVATDGSAKLPQRILPVVAERRARGLPTERFARVVATCPEPVALDDPGFAAEVEAWR
jgi:fructuronate reductase